ncbi:MAG: serine/threonine-protein kinase [Chloroflexi bacterium]|nr:serine/threonine-protein kinase [Chloroflexota bacterium]
MDIAPGTLLYNRYRIVRQLGKGGMGAVYLADDTSLEHPVAVKINQRATNESTSQFLREAHLLASLRNPHLPRVIDYFVLDQNQYLVMDYIPGDDLENRLRKEGAQPVDQVVHWAIQLGEALSYLHEQNPPVIHRDIKPANIKLESDGQVILVDFGIAKASDPSQSTATGAAGYTPGYAPPEQYGGARTGPYSDQYAFAATLYTLLSGQRPVDAVQRLLGQATLTPLQSLRPDIPQTIADAIQRGLAVRPDERFPNITDMVKVLNRSSSEATITQSAVSSEATIPLSAVPSEATIPVAAAVPSEATIPLAAPVAAAPRRVLSPKWKKMLTIFASAAVVLSVCFFSGGVYTILKANQIFSTPDKTIVLTSAAQGVAPSGTQNSPTAPQPSPLPTNSPPLPTGTPPPLPPSQTPVPPTAAPPTLQPSTTSAPLGGGQAIAFVSNRADGSTDQIWTMQVSTGSGGLVSASNFSQLTFNPGNKSQPAWSPNGKKLLYVAPGGTLNGKDMGLDVWVIKGLQRGQSGLTQKPGDDRQPAWSPDGNKIAFSNNGREDKIPQIYLMNPDGSQQTRISLEFNETYPIWSPDMQWLVYVISANNYPFLYMRGESGGYLTPEPFDRFSVNGRLGQVSDPAWSPDASQIAYTRLDGGHAQIWSVLFSSRGASLSRLTAGNADREPAWSPDSRWIVYSSTSSGNTDIFLMTSAGTLQTNLTKDAFRDAQPAWQP